MEQKMTRSKNTTKIDGAQSIARAMAVLRAIGAGPDSGSTLSLLVSSTQLSKTTVHRLLAVLVNDRMVRRNEDAKTYYLGEEVYVLGTLAAAQYGLHQLALPAVHRLAAASQDTAFLCMRTGDDVVCVHREEGAHPIRTHVLQPGDRHPIGYASFGVAILSAMDDEESDSMLARNAAQIKKLNNPNLTIEKIRLLVRAARERGYSVNPGLNFPESWGIALAILDGDRHPIGALVINAIRSRLQPDRQVKLAAALKAECDGLNRAMSSMRSRPRTQVIK